MNRLALTTLASAFALTGCMSAPDTPPSQPVSIEGEYRVAGVNSEEIDLSWAMTLTVDAERMRLVSQCMTPEWTYTSDGNVIRTERARSIMCKRGLLPQEQEVISVIDNAERTKRTLQNALQLQGPSGTLTLFSQ